ncbi:MAG: DNA replication/repair protein RecF, partial [Ferruginibacter sp.]|nr:DNA replication/repair protein RecF [Ferruginibacter sp.]
MQRFTKITATQFKNYSFSTFNFTERIIGICGLNGKGKTNLLDAIYYLCFTRSYFTKTDNLNTQFDADGFRLEGITATDVFKEAVVIETESLSNKINKIICVFKGVGKKEVSLNDVPYAKYSEHIGKFPCVMVAPDDIGLIMGGSEERRRFIDTVISQIDAEYLQQLIIYTKVLQQRNSLLKKFPEQGKVDWTLLEVLDEQLLLPGNYIYQKRNDFTQQLIPLAQQFYNQIASNDEVVTLQYESQLNNSDFFVILNQFRQKDFILQRSNGGIHKDDLLIQLNGQAFKTTASQGQRKSLLFALKLAEFELLKINKGFAP